MAITLQHDEALLSTEHLPLWWRCTLIVVAIVILCACSAPVTRTHLAPDKSLEQPNEEVQIVGEPGVDIQGTPAVPNQSAPVTAQPIPMTTVPQDEVAADGGVCMDAGYCGTDGRNDTDPYGPIIGPGDEYLCDGGDYISPAGVKADWTIVGLEQEDAISHYDTLDGRVIVEPSNRVCIYAPRFAAVRRVVQPIAHEQPLFVNQTIDELSPAKAAEALPVVSQKQRHAPAVDMAQQPPNLFRQRQQAGGLENLQATMEAFNSVGAMATLQILRTGEVSNAEKALVERLKQNAITLTGVQAPQVLFGVKQAHAEIGIKQPGIVYGTVGPGNPQLRLCKLASKGNAELGEEVEFTLRYDNIGEQVIGNVTIVDNLSTRLEYVPGSAKSSVDADFITQSNDGGSLILRWEIKDPVKPGEGGVLRFKAKVR
jgi:uncharacterized repeat protein (TIGR01451 family)